MQGKSRNTHRLTNQIISMYSSQDKRVLQSLVISGGNVNLEGNPLNDVPTPSAQAFRSRCLFLKTKLHLLSTDCSEDRRWSLLSHLNYCIWWCLMSKSWTSNTVASPIRLRFGGCVVFHSITAAWISSSMCCSLATSSLGRLRQTWCDLSLWSKARNCTGSPRGTVATAAFFTVEICEAVVPMGRDNIDNSTCCESANAFNQTSSNQLWQQNIGVVPSCLQRVVSKYIRLPNWIALFAPIWISSVVTRNFAATASSGTNIEARGWQQHVFLFERKKHVAAHLLNNN